MGKGFFLENEGRLFKHSKHEISKFFRTLVKNIQNLDVYFIYLLGLKRLLSL